MRHITYLIGDEVNHPNEGEAEGDPICATLEYPGTPTSLVGMVLGGCTQELRLDTLCIAAFCSLKTKILR